MVVCNICDWQGETFKDLDCGYGRVYKRALCPDCKSQPRHRSIYKYITENEIIPRKRSLKLLHFAPEKIFTDLFRSYSNIDYLSADIDPKKAMRAEDITNLSFSDSSFDVIFCIHVLEHVADDNKAMREMHKVLKEDGFALLDVPINYKLDKTYENPSIINPVERTKAFWQWNHLRLYGVDFRDKLEDAGFVVKLDNFINSLKEEDIIKYGLERKLIHLCTK